MTHKEKWLDTMVARHGSVEAVKEFMKQAQAKSRRNYKGTGGFYNNPELASEMGKRSARVRWGYDDKEDTETEVHHN